MEVSGGTLEWTLLAAAAAVPVFVGFAILGAMPRHLREAARKNAYRYGGAICSQRAYVEWKTKAQLVSELIGLQLLVLLPCVLLVCIFHQVVMPLDIGWAAFSSVVQDPESAKGVIRDLRDQHIEQAAFHGQSEEATRAAQGMVWNAWPMLVVMGVVATLGAVALMARMIVRSIRQYQAGVLERQQAYLMQDVAEVRAMERGTRAEGITAADSSEPSRA